MLRRRNQKAQFTNLQNIVLGDSDYSEPEDADLSGDDISEDRSYHSSEMGAEAIVGLANEGISPQKTIKGIYQIQESGAGPRKRGSLNYRNTQAFKRNDSPEKKSMVRTVSQVVVQAKKAADLSANAEVRENEDQYQAHKVKAFDSDKMYSRNEARR